MKHLLNLRAVGEDIAKHDYGGSDGHSHFRKQFCLITRALHCLYSLTQQFSTFDNLSLRNNAKCGQIFMSQHYS